MSARKSILGLLIELVGTGRLARLRLTRMSLRATILLSALWVTAFTFSSVMVGPQTGAIASDASDRGRVEVDADCGPEDAPVDQHSQASMAKKGAKRTTRSPKAKTAIIPGGPVIIFPPEGALRIRLIFDRSAARIVGEHPDIPWFATLSLGARATVEKWTQLNNRWQWVSVDHVWSVCAVDNLSALVDVSPPRLQFYRPRGVGTVSLKFKKYPGVPASQRCYFEVTRLQTLLQRVGGLPLFRVAVLAGDNGVITIQPRATATIMRRATGRKYGPYPVRFQRSVLEPINVTVDSAGGVRDG